MTSATSTFGSWKVGIRERVGALAASARLFPDRLRSADRQTLLVNTAFGLSLVLGLMIIAFVAFRPVGVPDMPAKNASAQNGRASSISGEAEPIPVVEPTILIPTDAQSARKINAGVPFSTAPNPAAAPFNALEIGDDLQRSVDCLATAMVYEAGNDPEGERAVGQVVLNRVRHPAFPNSVCAVVFQGSERKTGCQFSFTCDGSLDRLRPKPLVWEQSQELARQALTGAVFAPVGTATHYHTDWVVPYWSSSLDKITAVKTHLFFRWKGWWGTPPAFRQLASTQAPIIPALASRSDVHKTPEELATLRITKALETVAIRKEGNTFLIGWDATTSLDMLPQLAAILCGVDLACRVIGWPGGEKALPLSGNKAAVMRASFLYEPGIGAAPGRALWNCKSLKRTGVQCLSARDLAAVKLESPIDLALLAPPLSSLPALEALPAEGQSTVDTTPEALPAKTQSVANTEPAIVMPTRKHRDACAAMRGVAEADRIGPCAKRSY